MPERNDDPAYQVLDYIREHPEEWNQMDKNEDLAYQTLDYIRENPEEWDQRNYFCGTTACFAGRAIILNGEREGLSSGDIHWELFTDPGRTAAYLLGWSSAEASYVFHNMTKDFDRLEYLVKNVLNGEVARACGQAQVPPLFDGFIAASNFITL